MEESVQSQSFRLEALERRCRRLQLWCVLLSAGAMTACLSSALKPAPEILEARSIHILGTDGSVRAKLEATAASTGLAIFGVDESSLAYFCVVNRPRDSESGAFLHLESGKDRVNSITISATEEKSSCVLSDEDLSIASWVKADRAGVHFMKASTDPESTEPSSEGPAEDEADERPVLRLDVAGDEVTLEGRTPEGDVLFRQP